MGPKNSDSPRGKLIKKSSFCSIFGTDLLFDTISRVGSREISRYALGAEILQFENCFAINFEFQLSGPRTEGGGITLWVGRHQPASHYSSRRSTYGALPSLRVKSLSYLACPATSRAFGSLALRKCVELLFKKVYLRRTPFSTPHIAQLPRLPGDLASLRLARS